MEKVKKNRKLLIMLLIGIIVFLLAFLAQVFYLSTELSDAPTPPSYETDDEVDIIVESEPAYDLTAYQQFVTGLTEDLTSKKIAVTLYHFTEPEKNFSINGDKTMIAASTYKLFTAYSMYKSSQSLGCIKDMIVYSDNDCPESWGRWSLTTYDANSIGATNTNLIASPTITTSNDLATFLTQLYGGSLLSEAYTNQLISFMKAQVYREGISAGITEAEVADKVGFLDGILNDAGIVYSPKGDFVLVILTDGFSWQTIADLSADIYARI